MEISTIISISISILSIIMCIITFVKNGNKDIKKESTEESYRWGKLEERLNHFERQLNRVLDKLENYDKEIDTRIEKAMENHIKIYHKEN